MAGTFPCPHCGATYPVKPVLINRPVRCTQCKNVFMLRDDGYADKVGSDAGSGPVPATRQPPTELIAAEPPTTAAERAGTGPVPAAQQPTTERVVAGAPTTATERAAAARAHTAPPQAKATVAQVETRPPPGDDSAVTDRSEALRSETERLRAEAEANRTRTSRHKAKQEEMRRTMAATLSDAAHKALKSETVKQAAAKTERQQRKKKDGAVGELGPAVLTGYGEAEARNSRAWSLGALVLLVVAAALGWLLLGSSPEQRALKSFTEPDPAWRPATRIQEQQQRAWLADRAMPIILNIDEASITGSRTISLAPLRQVAAEHLEHHVLLDSQDFWVPEGQRVAAVQALREVPKGQQPIQALNQQGIPAKPAAALPQALQDAGMSERDAGLVTHLLEAQTDFRGGNWIRDLIVQGQIPEAIELAWFHGSNGRRLRLVGQNKYGSDDDVRYRGRLLRFVGWSGPQGNKTEIGNWHLLDVQAAGHDGTYPDGRGW